MCFEKVMSHSRKKFISLTIPVKRIAQEFIYLKQNHIRNYSTIKEFEF